MDRSKKAALIWLVIQLYVGAMSDKAALMFPIFFFLCAADFISENNRSAVYWFVQRPSERSFTCQAQARM
ncbi:hypothetical protein BWD10_07625 [Neisseria zoodegmatis]|uniref:Uncharacterized protein n=1 Tax=Neisseria zoodegmatis TaxID=326523 RepID=A0ABX3WF95_9NEIS|nr:hypothetical protein BWD10_07625 [Neisseria zoodegmatis]